MKKLSKKLGVVQNLGLMDRTLRILASVALLVGPVIHLQMTGESMSWHALVALLSIYPFMTAILGWDPFYSMLGTKTCRLTGRNQCGTLPYQVDAALGHDPHARNDYDHSLKGSQHVAGAGHL